MTTLVIATGNAHKISEIRAVLGDRLTYRSLRDFQNAPAVAETGDTFEANARLKSESMALWLLNTHHRDNDPQPATSWFVLADDSGLEVDALDGAPGVQSARFASPEFALEGNAPDGANNAKLLRLLAEVPAPRRSARFRCVLALTPVRLPLETRFFAGACEGRIGHIQAGSHGFGYDPLFIPDGFSESLAELGDATKNRISHRSHALATLAVLKALPGP